MHLRIHSRTAAWITIVLLAFAARPAPADPLTFSATGCGPYAVAEEPLLKSYLTDLVNKDGKSEFLIHLGDVLSGSKKAWPESEYAKVAEILKASTVPVFVVPGDNEWNDLANPDEGWRFWTKHFLHFEKNFKNAPAVQHQKERSENFAWVSKGVLLVGINLVGGRVHDRKEWATRMQHDVDWIRANIEQHGKDVRALVVFAQAMPIKGIEPFMKGFGEVCRTFTKPVLYLHADGHVWQEQQGWTAPNVLRVQTDQVGKAPPVLVTVTDDAMKPFVFDRRLKK